MNPYDNSVQYLSIVHSYTFCFISGKLTVIFELANVYELQLLPRACSLMLPLKMYDE